MTRIVPANPHAQTAKTGKSSPRPCESLAPTRVRAHAGARLRHSVRGLTGTEGRFRSDKVFT